MTSSSKLERGFTIILAIGTCATFLIVQFIHATILTPAANGMKAPDFMLIGYGHDGLTAWLQAMSDSDRVTFVGWHTVTWDLIFPFMLAWLLYRLLASVMSGFERFRMRPLWLRSLFLLTLVLPYLVFDMVENTALTNLMVQEVELLENIAGPKLTMEQSGLLATWTSLKFLSLTVAVIVLATMAFAQWRARKASA